MAEAEVVKLQNHLSLLREEYVKLQNKLATLEKKYQVALASSGKGDQEDGFVSRLLKTVSELFDKDLYSDLVVKVPNGEIKAHRFVLAARSDYWGVDNLSTVSELDFTGVPGDVAHCLLKWVYTDNIDIKSDDTFLLELLKVAGKFRLTVLKERCETALMSSVNVRNCIKLYQTAEEIGAEKLKNHCSELISSHWDDFTGDDFASMPAPLLYSMFKQKTTFPLHTAIRAKREDVVFLYLIEYDSQLPGKLNEIDNHGDLPLDLALTLKQESIAQTLVKHRVNMNMTDNSGKYLLHKAIKRSDEFSAKFIIENNANVNAMTHLDKETALHMVASFNPEITPPDVMTGMANIAQLLLDRSADANAQDSAGSTPLHRAISAKNEEVFTKFLHHQRLDLELQNADGEAPLWLALKFTDQGYSDTSMAARLITRGSSADAINSDTGDSLLHLATRGKMEPAALFLAEHGAQINLANKKGESPLHLASQNGLPRLVQLLLVNGSNPNAQTLAPSSETPNFSQMNIVDSGEENRAVYKQTPLHLAIANNHEGVVKVFLQHKAATTSATDNLKILPNFNLKDSQDQTALGVALWTGMHAIATSLITGGANINDVNADGMTLLHQAIIKQDGRSALFLLEHQADINTKTRSNDTPFQLAIKSKLPDVAAALCSRNVDMNVMDEDGNCPLWQALEMGQEDIASIMVQHNCDTNMWGAGPDGCYQTLLHRALDENNEPVACFLIRSGCDINSPRRPGPGGAGGDEANDQQTPLHIAATWGQQAVVQCLVEFNADINAQDADGNSPLHVAIRNQYPEVTALVMSHPGLNLAIRDKQGWTPFATAMMTKNNKAAQAILDRQPYAAEQVDSRGRNFLHIAIQKKDIESVLFLISVHANINSPAQDAHRFTPLHLAVQAGDEIIVRNLVLAGASIDEVTMNKQTALHLAAANDQASICSVLIDNGINVDALDDNLNNALHVAVQGGNLNAVRTLLTESRVNATAINMRGQTPLLMLGQYGKENAAAIFELFRESMPDYPLDHQDPDGNTVLLLAYTNGNSNLCRAIVRATPCLGIPNKQGMSIFNAPVATKQLLFKLLDMLSTEPPWSEGDNCLECGIKFSIKTRKHHCRHCGRLLCAKCSDKDMPIIKYNQTKPVRVCEICFDVLSLGSAS